MNTKKELERAIEERKKLEEEMAQTFPGYSKDTVALVPTWRLAVMMSFLLSFLIATFISFAPFSNDNVTLICIISMIISGVFACYTGCKISVLADHVYWWAKQEYIEREQEKIREYRKIIHTEKGLRPQEKPYVAQMRAMTQDIELVRGVIDLTNIDSWRTEEHNGEPHHYATVMWPILDHASGVYAYAKYFCTPDGCDDLIIQIMLRRHYYDSTSRKNMIEEYKRGQ